MFREIRNSEAAALEKMRKDEEERRKAQNGYLKIKPEHTTIEEATAFINNLFGVKN